MIHIQIESQKIEHNFNVIDTPGLIQVDLTTGQGSLTEEDNSAMNELSEMLKSTCLNRRVSYLIVHDATTELDDCGGLAFLPALSELITSDKQL